MYCFMMLVLYVSTSAGKSLEQNLRVVMVLWLIIKVLKTTSNVKGLFRVALRHSIAL